MDRAPATVYAIPGSHACRTTILMLDHKRIAHRVVELPTGLHPLLVRLRGFPGSAGPIRMLEEGPSRMSAAMDRLGTVPALSMEGHRIQRNIEIAQFLEQFAPEPPLYPSDPARRAEVEAAQRWGDEPLQMAARRVVMCASAHGLQTIHERGARGRLGALLAHSDRVRLTASRFAARTTFRAGPARESELLAELAPLLDHVEQLVDRGTIGGEEANAADLTIAPSLALLDYRLDLREDLRARSFYPLLDRLLPER
jgi:glutathione S-transferase